MDTVTQALLGGVIGKACFSDKLGTRAIFWGAVGGAIPDLDILHSSLSGPWGEFLYHRGWTHALLFAPLLAPVLGYGVWRFYAYKYRKQGKDRTEKWTQDDPAPQPNPGHRNTLIAWMGLFFFALLTHPLLDIFTSYGTQILIPFSRERVALNAVGIVDPVYSLILIAGLVLGTKRLYRRWGINGKKVAWMALILSTAYLFYGLWLNDRAEQVVRKRLNAEGIQDAQVTCYPTVLQPFLRRIVVRFNGSLRVGTLTMLKPESPKWETFRIPEHPLIQKVLQTPEGELFEWFAMREISPHITPICSSKCDSFLVEIDDIRYGFSEPLDQGIWGIRARFDSEGRVVEPVERFNRPFPDPMDTFLKLWNGTFGTELKNRSKP